MFIFSAASYSVVVETAVNLSVLYATYWLHCFLYAHSHGQFFTPVSITVCKKIKLHTIIT